jgi:hypothetical protein
MNVCPVVELRARDGKYRKASYIYYFERFSLCFFLFSMRSFLVIGFFLEPFPMPN